MAAERAQTDSACEQDLAASFAAGDRLAAEVLLDRFAPRVTQLVHRLLGWQGDVEDVVQEVFVAALDGRARFRGASSAETWLTRIAVNKCRAHLRKAWVRKRLFQAWAERQTEEVVTSADRQAIVDEEAIRVREAVGRLPRKYREVLVLFYLESMTISGAAEVLGVRPGTVEVRLSRARRQLAEVLGPVHLP